jgi:pyruvate kinase
VLDGTDAVMLSAETAAGKHPVAAVAAMDRVCKVAEEQESVLLQERRAAHQDVERVDQAIALATMYTANNLGVKAIAALTESGATTLWMSRIASNVPIYALTSHAETRRKVTLYRGVYPVAFQITTSDHATLNREALDELRRRGTVREGDLVIITKGDLTGVKGGTNAMKIAVVGGQRES